MGRIKPTLTILIRKIPIDLLLSQLAKEFEFSFC